MAGLSISEVNLDLVTNTGSTITCEPGMLPGYYANLDLIPGSRSYKISKRLFDIIFALVGLIMTMPLAVIIGVVIKLDSRGPILYRQLRVGQRSRRPSGPGILSHGQNKTGYKLFYIYKFRTMYQNEDQFYRKPVNADDVRLTRSGTFLRRTSLDELPQLWNVLCGDMSLVGPRPEIVAIVANYGNLEMPRLSVKPGLTGLWQLYGNRNLAIHENLEYDLDYINKRSFLLDLKILVKTVGFVFRCGNV